MLYAIDQKKLEVVIIKKNNKNTYIRIKDDMKIYVTTNYFVTKKQIKKLLDDNYSSLQRMLNRIIMSKEEQNKFYYLGKQYDIIFMNTDKVEIINSKIYTTDQKMLVRWYQQNMKDLFLSRLNKWYDIFEEDIPFPILKIRKMKTRWGVCNRKNISVTLNSELMRYDIEKIDYVIIHELSHFVHFDHSKDFWNLVSKYCPDYKRIRKELRG